MVAQTVNLLPKLYTVAAQKSKDSPVHIYKIRETDEEELLLFIKRLLEVDSLTACEFLEVHRQLPEGQGVLVIYGDTRKAWPRGVETIHHETIIARNTRIGQQFGVYPALPSPEPLVIDTDKIVSNLVVTELFDTNVARVKPLTVKVA